MRGLGQATLRQTGIGADQGQHAETSGRDRLVRKRFTEVVEYRQLGQAQLVTDQPRQEVEIEFVGADRFAVGLVRGLILRHRKGKGIVWYPNYTKLWGRGICLISNGVLGGVLDKLLKGKNGAGSAFQGVNVTLWQNMQTAAPQRRRG